MTTSKTPQCMQATYEPFSTLGTSKRPHFHPLCAPFSALFRECVSFLLRLHLSHFEEEPTRKYPTSLLQIPIILYLIQNQKRTVREGSSKLEDVRANLEVLEGVNTNKIVLQPKILGEVEDFKTRRQRSRTTKL